MAEPRLRPGFSFRQNSDPCGESAFGARNRSLRSGGKPGKLERIDDYTLRITFEHPYASFMDTMAASSYLMVQSPKHYLLKYHPEWGDQDLIAREMKAFRLPGKRNLYMYIKNFANPEHPRLWPWVYQTYRSTPPQVYVRNPYFWAVDEAGNQLPYIDRLQFAVKGQQTLALAFASGMAAITTTLLALTKAGDHVVLFSDCYRRTRQVCLPLPLDGR